jgi:hypothetical protein
VGGEASDVADALSELKTSGDDEWTDDNNDDE